MADYTVGISAEEGRMLSEMYWAEEAEYKMGIHPTQVKERILEVLRQNEINFHEITFLDWKPEGPRVRVSTDGYVYGVFNYETNEFEDTPESRLQEMTKDFEINRRD